MHEGAEMRQSAPLLCLLLAGCLAESEFHPVPVPVGGPAPAPAPAPVQPVNPRVAPQNPPLAPILDDPDDPSTAPDVYDEPIMAGSYDEALRKCQQIAKDYGLKLVNIKKPNRVRPGQNQWYRCWFQSNPRE